MSYYKYKAGFTVVELVVTMGIIAMLFSTTMLTFRSRNVTQQLAESKNLYMSALALARTYARTGKICCGRTSVDKPSGYGVAVDNTDPTKFYLYAEVNNNNGYNSGSDIIMETYQLDSKLLFDSTINDIQFKTGKSIAIYYDGSNNQASADAIIDIKDTGGTVTAQTTLYYISGLIQ